MGYPCTDWTLGTCYVSLCYFPMPKSHFLGRAVCRPPAGVSRHDIGITPQVGGGCSVTVTTYFANGTSSSACPAGNCNCAVSAPIYGTQCGTLYASVYLYLDLAVTLSGPSLATYLDNLGIGNVNTVYGMVFFQLGSSQPLNWPIDVWTNLEVVRADPDGAGFPHSLLCLSCFPLPGSPPPSMANAQKGPACLLEILPRLPEI
jgi:hypothetical protein